MARFPSCNRQLTNSLFPSFSRACLIYYDSVALHCDTTTCDISTLRPYDSATIRQQTRRHRLKTTTMLPTVIPTYHLRFPPLLSSSSSSLGGALFFSIDSRFLSRGFGLLILSHILIGASLPYGFTRRSRRTLW